jgi:hypothetical protein
MAGKVKTRRETLAEIGRVDALNRCAWCRINLYTVDAPIVSALSGRRWCSSGCYEDEQAWEAYRADKLRDAR